MKFIPGWKAVKIPLPHQIKIEENTMHIAKSIPKRITNPKSNLITTSIKVKVSFIQNLHHLFHDLFQVTII